jgi:protocatechuate 3,4-dioxygenase beta subunit
MAPMLRPRWLPLAAVLLILPSPAVAQVGGAVRDRQQPNVVRRGTASIVGRVIAADSGRPLRLARVSATAPELSDGRVSMSDENGMFEFPELPAGGYNVSASKTGYITMNFGQRRPLRAGRPIEVRDGQRVRDIDFRLPRGSVITGRVLDQDGEPLVRASIRAMRYRFVQGERRIEPGGGAETDDRGQFRIYGLPPGTYFVSATAQGADAGAAVRVAATSDSPHTPGSLTYAPTYYPGVAALSDAAAVTAPIGEEVAGIDFSLQLVTAARVTGIVAGASGMAANTTVLLVPDDSRGMSGQSYSGRVGRDGTFSISNVPPGRYIAIARGQPRRGEQDMFAVQPLSVSGALVADVTLVLAGGTTISGQVTFDGAATPTAQDYTRLRIGLWAPAAASLPMFGGPMNTTPRPDGSFTIANVPAGSRLFRVAGLQSPWALKGVYLDGRDVTDEMFDVKPGETAGRVTIVVSDKATTLTGAVRDEQDQPLSDFTVIAFPSDSNLWRPQSRLIQAVRPDKNGLYTVRGLPPGEYLLRAVDDVDQGEWYDPELLQALRTGATRVMLQDGDNKSVDLKLMVASTEQR